MLGRQWSFRVLLGVRTMATFGRELCGGKHLAADSECPKLTPGFLRLYSMRYCPYAQRTRLLLEYKQIPHEVVNVNLKQRPMWFRKKNINGLVPILEQDGVIVYESTVCNDYLDRVFPNPAVKPNDFMKNIQDRMLSEGFGKVISLFYEIPTARQDTEEVYQKTIRRFRRFLNHYDNALQERGDYFGGNSPGMVDFMIWPWFERLPVLTYVAPEADITDKLFPALAQWIHRMYTLPCVKATLCTREEHMHFMQKLRQGNPEYDFQVHSSL